LVQKTIHWNEQQLINLGYGALPRDFFKNAWRDNKAVFHGDSIGDQQPFLEGRTFLPSLYIRMYLLAKFGEHPPDILVPISPIRGFCRKTALFLKKSEQDFLNYFSQSIVISFQRYRVKTRFLSTYR